MTKFDELRKSYTDELVKIAEAGGLTGISRATLEKELENKISHYVVALENGVPIGFIGVWNIADVVEVIDIAVAPEFKRQGIGKALIENVLKYCKTKNASEIQLEVRESNIPAISLYEKMNFVKVGIREKYYSDGENAILMSLNLR